MFRYKLAKILPYFLQKRITVAQLAREAGVSHQVAYRAISGEKVAAPIIAKVADALGFNAEDFLEGKNSMTQDNQISAGQIKILDEKSPLQLQHAILGEIMKAEERGSYLRDVHFSTSSDGQIRYSAMLILGSKGLG